MPLPKIPFVCKSISVHEIRPNLDFCIFKIQFHGAPEYFTDILSIFNLVFTLLFTVECAFKLLSFGPKVNINQFFCHINTHFLCLSTTRHTITIRNYVWCINVTVFYCNQPEPANFLNSASLKYQESKESVNLIPRFQLLIYNVVY